MGGTSGVKICWIWTDSKTVSHFSVVTCFGQNHMTVTTIMSNHILTLLCHRGGGRL